MSLVRVCDVCEGSYDPGEEFGSVAMPTAWVGADDAEEANLVIDVCSVECLADMGTKLMGGVVEQVDEPESQETVAGPAPESQDDGMARERFSSIPETARTQYQDPTGVRIKTLGGHQ